MTLVSTLRMALVFAHGAAFGAFLLSPGFMMSGDVMFGFWWMMGAVTAISLISLVPLKPVARPSPLAGALFFAVGLCAALGAGAWYFQDRIVWAAVELNALLLLAGIGGLLALLLMLVVMDRIRKAGERRELRARGELT